VKSVLVPIFRKDQEKAAVLEAAHRIAADLGAKVDDREGQSPGAKFFHWERRGVPIVFELGPRDLASNNIVLKRRDAGAKQVVPQAGARTCVEAALKQMQSDLYAAAKERLRSNTVLANSIEEVESILNDVTAEKGGGKFVMAHVKDDPACDQRMKDFKATVRCIPLVDEFDGPGKCIITGEQVDRRAVIAKAY
jgi:prolyl-tRNA synthetase